MRDMVSVPLKLSDYIFNDDPGMLTGNEIILGIYASLSSQGRLVSNKDIILCLINNIECEKNVLMQDKYLKALEYIVYRTPDDWER